MLISNIFKQEGIQLWPGGGCWQLLTRSLGWPLVYCFKKYKQSFKLLVFPSTQVPKVLLWEGQHQAGLALIGRADANICWTHNAGMSFCCCMMFKISFWVLQTGFTSCLSIRHLLCHLCLGVACYRSDVNLCYCSLFRPDSHRLGLMTNVDNIISMGIQSARLFSNVHFKSSFHQIH